jgi:hypothetical protein
MGPDETGRYLVRQIGIVTLAKNRAIAVAMATEPADGTFEAGIANLTRIARWLIARVDQTEVPQPRCRP